VSFVKWYEKDNNHIWVKEKEKLSLLEIIILTIEYEFYCYKEGLLARWDG